MVGRKSAEFPALEEVISEVLPDLPEGMVPDAGEREAWSLPTAPSNRLSKIVKSGLEMQVCHLVFAGMSAQRIGKRLGMAHDTIDRYLNSERFEILYERMREELHTRIGEHLRRNISDHAVSALNDLIEQRDKAKGYLRRTLNMDILALYEKYGKGEREGGKGILERVKEIQVKRGKDGQIVETHTEKETLRQTTTEPVSAPIPVGSSSTARSDEEGSEGSRDLGPAETT